MIRLELGVYIGKPSFSTIMNEIWIFSSKVNVNVFCLLTRPSNLLLLKKQNTELKTDLVYNRLFIVCL